MAFVESSMTEINDGPVESVENDQLHLRAGGFSSALSAK